MKKILGIALAIGLAIVPFYASKHAPAQRAMAGPPGSTNPCTSCGGDQGH